MLSLSANVPSFATLGKKRLPSSSVQTIKRTSEDVCEWCLHLSCNFFFLVFVLLGGIITIARYSLLLQMGGEGASLVPWVGGPPSFGFYLREAFQNQTNTEKIIHKSH